MRVHGGAGSVGRLARHLRSGHEAAAPRSRRWRQGTPDTPGSDCLLVAQIVAKVVDILPYYPPPPLTQAATAWFRRRPADIPNWTICARPCAESAQPSAARIRRWAPLSLGVVVAFRYLFSLGRAA
jgi:hypothetical protein